MNKEYSYAIDNCALPWLMLDFQFRWEDILHEVEQLDEWIPYRESSGKNWSSLALHGVGGEFGSVYHEELEHVRYDWTSIADKCPKTKDFFIARDHIGIVPLYIGWDKNGVTYVASEMKAIETHCEKLQEFPPGHFYQGSEKKFVQWYKPKWAENNMDGRSALHRWYCFNSIFIR